jgi:hypothetical protein
MNGLFNMYMKYNKRYKHRKLIGKIDIAKGEAIRHFLIALILSMFDLNACVCFEHILLYIIKSLNNLPYRHCWWFDKTLDIPKRITNILKSYSNSFVFIVCHNLHGCIKIKWIYYNSNISSAVSKLDHD